ncbi:hypothetical protein [Paenibacillus sinensis]|nr:hypothetical protein [Paenibacillus sinensis]
MNSVQDVVNAMMGTSKRKMRGCRKPVDDANRTMASDRMDP